MKRQLLIPLLLSLLLLFTGCQALAGETPGATTSPSGPSSQQTPGYGSISDFEQTIESIYAQVNPSVVNIQVVLKPQSTTPSIPGIPGLTPAPPAQALGSGFVWDTNGNIVTNNHVISGADRISVTFYDDTTVDAKLVGADPDSDLAVVKVDPGAIQLVPVKMADSAKLKVGQLAVAIGNPFGLQNTLTVGFVSGLGRLIPANQNAIGPSYSIPDIVQTDASLNPGNSGGVLLDNAGMVIGVTAAIDTQSGTSSGVGFAIPSAIVQQVVPELIKTGTYQHPWLGLTIISLNPDLATAMNLKPNQRGALVSSLTPESPAEKAGLQPSTRQVTIDGRRATVGGDVITAFNGQAVKGTDDLIAELARTGAVGQIATLTVLRDNQEIQVQVTLAARPKA